MDQLDSNNWALDATDSHKTSGVVVRANPHFVSTVTRRVKPYKNVPYMMRPALEAVADYMRTVMIPRTFKDEGPGWAPLAKRTQRERIAQGYNAQHPILFRSGDLFAELTEKAHTGHVEIIRTGGLARVEIAGSSQKYLRNQKGDWALHIPPRPMVPGTGGLPIAPGDQVQMDKIFKDAIGRIAQKARDG